MKFVPAVAYHFCLNLPATFSQPRTKKFSQLCNVPVNVGTGSREHHIDVKEGAEREEGGEVIGFLCR